MKSILLFTLAIICFSCTTKTQQSELPKIGPEPDAISFLGTPLFSKPADSVALIKSDSVIALVENKAELTEDDYVTIGAQLVSTNRFKAAIDNYTQGLTKFPQSFKLYRHRGHRYLNLRQMDNGIADLNKAEELIRSQPEVWEYDAAGKPTATYQHQIWYHIGLYYFLNKEYDKSASAYEKSYAACKEGKNKAGAGDWLYNAYQRSGQKDKIEALLKAFTLDFQIEDKEYPYYRRLLLYKGLIKPEELVDANKPIADMSLIEATKLYGLANWYAYQGDAAKAQELYKKVVGSANWQGFAVAAAEKDLAP